uniref:GULP PTB domain containing engulfment adaptor 1a n=1 Tax=Neolamprologus brichardi TaxID=32507 RepID=A0A3Q4MY68_NEOBR
INEAISHKSWMHTPEALAKHYIAYNAKFLGNTEVEAPKGTEVVKDAVRKLKVKLVQMSLLGNELNELKIWYHCILLALVLFFVSFAFQAEEITLTIGQAFDLAYKKFLESGGKDVETRKQIGSLQKRIQELETENSELKKQLQELEEQLMIAHVPPAGSISMKPQSTDIFDMVPFSPVTPLVPTPASNGLLICSVHVGKDLFGAEPFDPFTCGAADFPPDIQSKLDEMQEGFKMGLTLEGTVFSLDPLDSRC